MAVSCALRVLVLVSFITFCQSKTEDTSKNVISDAGSKALDPASATIEDSNDAIRKKKSATTTLCVEIRPSGPYQRPFQICEPAESKPYAPAATPSSYYSAPGYEEVKPSVTAKPAAAYEGPAKTYSAQAKPTSAPAYASSKPYAAHSPSSYSSVSYRSEDGAEEDMMEESEDREPSGDFEHMMRSVGQESYGMPVTYLAPTMKQKHKKGHNGLVITCQPSLAGYAATVPSYGGAYGGAYGGGSYGGYRSSTARSYNRYERPSPPKAQPYPGYGPAPSYKVPQPSYSYKAPVPSYSAPPSYNAPVYRPAPSYNPPAPSYAPPAYKSPAYKPVYAPAPSYKPAYAPAPAYKPVYAPAPAPAYKPTYVPAPAPAPAYKPTYAPAPAPAYKPSYAPAPAPAYKPAYAPAPAPAPTPGYKPTYPSAPAPYSQPSPTYGAPAAHPAPYSYSSGPSYIPPPPPLPQPSYAPVPKPHPQPPYSPPGAYRSAEDSTIHQVETTTQISKEEKEKHTLQTMKETTESREATMKNEHEDGTVKMPEPGWAEMENTKPWNQRETEKDDMTDENTVDV